MPDERLKNVANHILDTLVDELTTVGIEVPTRRYVHHGQWAADYAGQKCAEAFIVASQSSFQGQIGFTGSAVPEAAIRCAMPMSTQFQIVLLRCVPMPKSDGTPPTANQLHDSADRLMLDAWTLPAVIIDSTLNGTLKTINVDLVGIGAVVPYGPQGGVGGTVLNLFVSIL